MAENAIKPIENHLIMEELLEKFRQRKFNWKDARNLLKINNLEADWEFFFQEIAKIRFELFNEPKEMKFYTPGRNFPAISVTGSDCALECEHCDSKYLSSMIQAETEEKFISKLDQIKEKKSIGALLSGGCTPLGKVPLLKYKEIIKDFKKSNKFYFNAHVGLINHKEALALKECGVDNISYDLILDQKVISDVFHLPYKIEDYITSYNILNNSGIQITPHILVGARFGKIAREIDVIKFLSEKPPDLVVIIAMIPPKINGKIISPFEELHSADIAKIIFFVKAFLPNTEISLGCMRSRGKNSFEMESWSISAGVNRMEIPRQATIKWVEERGFKTSYYGACCSIDKEFEKVAEATDVRGYLKNRE